MGSGISGLYKSTIRLGIGGGSAEGAPAERVGAMTESGDTSYTNGRSAEEYEALAKDPSHGGNIRQNSRRERYIALALEKEGKLGKVIRDPQANKGADFIDTTTGIKWDVKSPISKPAGHTRLRNGAFEISDFMKKVFREINNGHNVIIDVSRIEQRHRNELRTAVQESGISDKIMWFGM